MKFYYYVMISFIVGIVSGCGLVIYSIVVPKNQIDWIVYTLLLLILNGAIAWCANIVDWMQRRR